MKLFRPASEGLAVALGLHRDLARHRGARRQRRRHCSSGPRGGQNGRGHRRRCRSRPSPMISVISNSPSEVPTGSAFGARGRPRATAPPRHGRRDHGHRLLLRRTRHAGRADHRAVVVVGAHRGSGLSPQAAPHRRRYRQPAETSRRRPPVPAGGTTKPARPSARATAPAPRERRSRPPRPARRWSAATARSASASGAAGNAANWLERRGRAMRASSSSSRSTLQSSYIASSASSTRPSQRQSVVICVVEGVTPSGSAIVNGK